MDPSQVPSLVVDVLDGKILIHRDEDGRGRIAGHEIPLEGIRNETHDWNTSMEIDISAAVFQTNGGWSLKPYNAEKPQEWQNDRIRDVLSLSPRSSDTRIVLIELQDRLRSYQYSKSDELTLLETIFDWLSESKGTTPLLLTKATKRCQRSFDVLSSVLASSTLHIFHMRDARKSHGVKVDGTTIRTYYKFCSPFGPVLRPRYPYSESICCAVGQVINLEETDAFGICSSVVVQSGAEDVTLSFEDVIKYAATVDNSPVGRSLALMATCAHRSYQAWDSYIATSEKFARLLVRGLQIYPGEDCANNDKQWINSTKDKAWTMDDLEILGQSLTQLEQRLQYTKQSLYQNVQTTRFISRKVLAEISHQSERHVSPSDIPETVSKVRDELGRFDELHARLPSLEVSLDRTEKLFRNLQQLALVRNSFNALKLEYISQNYIRVAAFMTILFLPGIFVSTLIGSRVIETSWELSSYWLVLALPITFVVVGSLCVMCCFPGFTLGGRSCYRAVFAALWQTVSLGRLWHRAKDLEKGD